MANQDFAFEPIPDDKTVSGWRIAMVLTGIIIGLPAFIIGANLGDALGFGRGVLTIVLGGLVLSAIAIATGAVGAKTRLTTAMIAKHTFGSLGGRLVSGVLAIACLGWFGVTAEVFGQSLHRILADLGMGYIPQSLVIALGGSLMILTTIFGFSGLQRLSTVTIPFLAILIGYTAFLAMRDTSFAVLLGSGSGGTTLGDGVSAIVGSKAVAVAIYPDLCRFSRKPRDAAFAAVLTYSVAMPAIIMLAMIPSIIMHERDLIVIMTALGLGIPALALLVVKAWATNSGNLYVAALSAANFLLSKRQTYIVIGAGALGTLTAVFGITDKLVPFLVALGVSVPPIAGIYVAHFWVVRPSYNDDQPLPSVNFAAFICWGLGIAVAVAARFEIVTLSGVSAINSMLAAAATYLAWCRFRRRAVGGASTTAVVAE